MAEGTVLMRTTSSLAGRLGRERMSWERMTWPPWASVAKSSKTERSKEMEVEARTPWESEGPKVDWAQQTMATALRWERATGLGRPVEPEVEMT